MPQGDRQLQFPTPEIAKLLCRQQMNGEAAHATEMWLWEIVRRDVKQR
jgi:hypothetical protein